MQYDCISDLKFIVNTCENYVMPLGLTSYQYILLHIDYATDKTLTYCLFSLSEANRKLKKVILQYRHNSVVLSVDLSWNN